MGMLAIIGGSGFTRLPGFTIDRQEQPTTRYGATSAPLLHGQLAGLPLLFLARHGADHQIPPHRINYRANLRALADAGATEIIALAAVGGITAQCAPETFCVPDQLIDYTSARISSFYEGENAEDGVTHIDFTDPYCPSLRAELLHCAEQAEIALQPSGCYGVTQGPRLETSAEIRRLERDGCDLVGMTAMPEAALARELGLCYATLAFVVNWAAGKAAGTISMKEIEQSIGVCTHTIERLLIAFAKHRVTTS